MITTSLMRVNPNDTVVIRATPDDIFAQDIKQLFDFLQDQYPRNRYVFIPDNISLQSCSKEDLKRIRAEINKLIGEENGD